MKKRALITGITGMVGSHLADYLLENTDWEIYGMCRWRSPLDNISHLVEKINKKDRIHLLYGDLRDFISIHDVVKRSKPDYIFHLAAQSYPQTSHAAGGRPALPRTGPSHPHPIHRCPIHNLEPHLESLG